MKLNETTIKCAIIALVAAVSLCGASYCAEKKLASGYINDGITNYDNGNFIEAILNLRAAEQLSPNPVTANKYLGLAYSKLSLWPQAAKEFCKLIYMDPSDPERALILQKINEWEKRTDRVAALAQYSFYSIKYKNRIYSQPDNLLNYLSLAEVYKCSGRYQEAENFFRALMKDKPDNMDFQEYLAEALYLDRKYAEAGAMYRKILDSEPLNSNAIIGLDLVLKKRYEDALFKDPSDTAARLKLARTLKDMKRYEDAIAQYEIYLRSDSANVDLKRELDETKIILSAFVIVK